MPEKFEVLFSTIQKPVIGAEDFDKCKKYIYGLIASRNGNETFTLKNIDCIHISKITTRDEQFRIAFEELVKMMKNFVHCSPVHEELFKIFVEISGIRLENINFLKREAVEPHQKLPIKRALEPEKVRNTSRSNSPLSKKAKKMRAPSWMGGEEVNLLDFYNNIYEKSQQFKTKEFVGREKYGDHAQNNLYSHLKMLPVGDKRDPRGRPGNADVET